MNTTQYDGGPAFPRPSSMDSDGFTEDAQDGMSLRDWFAGMALQGFFACSDPSMPCAEKNKDQVARHCYVYADAMLAARREAR